jgi:hypothetical protein
MRSKGSEMPKIWILLGTAAAAGAAATSAAAQDDTAFRTAMMARCATIGDKSARLACYDAAQRSGPIAMPAPSSGQAPMASSAPAYTPAPRYATAPVSRGDDFGLEESRDRRRHDSGPSQIKARAVAATENGAGYWTIRLDNGASWKMVELDQQFRPPSRNEAVRIRKGALGGYLMDVDHQPAVRVERVD